jgi:hypothetical protein
MEVLTVVGEDEIRRNLLLQGFEKTLYVCPHVREETVLELVDDDLVTPGIG